MIESVIETKPWRMTASSGGTISGSAGSNAIVGVGTSFDLDLVVNEIIVFTDDGGRRAMGQVSVITDALNITLYNNLVNAVTAASFTIIKLADLKPCFFRADNTVNRSPIIGPNGGTSQMGVNTGGTFKNEININEGVLVKSAYIRMPFQYTLADSFFTLTFSYLNSSGGFVASIDTIGEGGELQIPTENIEIPVNAFIPTPAGALTSWQIGVDLTNSLANLGSPFAVDDFDIACASQVNGPDSLNGQLLPIFIGLRIVHAASELV